MYVLHVGYVMRRVFSLVDRYILLCIDCFPFYGYFTVQTSSSCSSPLFASPPPLSF